MIYIAFLRGINVGGKNIVKMEELREVFESLGFSDVKTILNSGNVTFMSEGNDKKEMKIKIENALKKTFGREIAVLIRSCDDIRKLIQADPFKDIQVTKDTRLYVTFFSEKLQNTLKSAYISPQKDLQILRLTNTEICIAVTISANKNTTDTMGFLEKEFGKKITTRNWNTVLKLV